MTGPAAPSCVSLLISILRPNQVLTCGIPPDFRGGVHLPFQPPYTIGSVPSSVHAIAYRWCSLPRVCRHRVSKPQGSFKRVLPWQVTMDQLICASLSHTHYWYEVDNTYCYLFSLQMFLWSFHFHQPRSVPDSQ